MAEQPTQCEQTAETGGNTFSDEIITVCGGCPSECAFAARVLPDGSVEARVPVEGHPCRTSKLCERGVRRLRLPAVTKNRVEHPLRRWPDGTFEQIGWDEAYAQIAARLRRIVDESGPRALALTLGIASSAGFHACRLMDALGSPNVYGAAGACDVSRRTGWDHTLGYSPQTDVAHADYIVYLGRSPLESASATEGDLVRAALDRGCTVVAVDPRRNPTVEQASDWLQVRPGRDLALLLGIAHVLVEEDLYDHAFVEGHTGGFDEFARGLEPYTAAWAAAECGVDERDVLRVARGLGAARPRAVVDCGFHGGLGVTYVNCVQTARMIALVNALLGNYGVPGGCLVPPSDAPLGALDPVRFCTPNPAPGPKAGAERYPLVDPAEGLCTTLGDSVERGEIRGLIAYASNPVMGYGNARDWQRMLGGLDLLVAVDIRLSETARMADYVLPDVTFLECDRGVGSRGEALYYRNRVLEPRFADARPARRIFRELADALGVGESFAFTDEELARAQVAPYGVDLDELRRRGSVTLADGGRASEEAPAGAGTAGPEGLTGPMGSAGAAGPVIRTPSGRIEFASDLWERTGLGRVPFWQPPLVDPDPDDPTAFRLINGNSAFESHTSPELLSTGAADPARLALASVWMHTDRAAVLGVSDGDVVEVYSELGCDRAVARVTRSVHPEALFTSASPGGRSGEHAGADRAAEGRLGVGPLDHTPLRYDPLTGAALTQENVVHVRRTDD